MQGITFYMIKAYYNVIVWYMDNVLTIPFSELKPTRKAVIQVIYKTVTGRVSDSDKQPKTCIAT